jgi:hypothetical protein
MESDKLKPRPKRRWGGKAQWVVVLDTGRFGDWVIIETPDTHVEDDVRKMLTRTQKKKVTSIRRTVKTGG